LDDRIIVDYVKVITKNFRLDSNANDTTVAEVSRLCNEKFQSILSLNQYSSRQTINRGSSVTTRWAGYIESTLQRIVPVNILLTL
jgi:hypothetical protein